VSRAIGARIPSHVALARFLRTPKGLLTVVLSGLAAAAAPGQGLRLVMRPLAASVLAASVVDVPILRWRTGKWTFPSGAVLTGLIVAMVISAHEPWYVAAVTSAIAIASKYLLRSRAANLFNPAALAIVFSSIAFQTGQDWWGALPDLPLAALALLVGTGWFIADRVNKLPMALAFLGVYFTLFTVAAFFTSPAGVAEVFRTPDLHAVLYFAFFILTDPPTSPTRYPDQVRCAVLVAAVSFVVFVWTGVVYYLLAGVLAGNIWEAWRRHRVRARRHAPVRHAAPAGAGADRS
jgi:Na+-translocating ferredoxin:NAD+ oxidoreductase RnfD subunit